MQQVSGPTEITQLFKLIRFFKYLVWQSCKPPGCLLVARIHFFHAVEGFQGVISWWQEASGQDQALGLLQPGLNLLIARTQLPGRLSLYGQQTGIIHWRLANDSTIREAFFETDSDRTNRFFAQGDGTRMDPEVYRELILAEHGALNEAYPRRYKRFIVSGDDTHGAVQVTAPTPNFPFPQPFSFYTQDANGTPLTYWATEFVRIGQRQSKFGWKDIVEDYVPVPIP